MPKKLTFNPLAGGFDVISPAIVQTGTTATGNVVVSASSTSTISIALNRSDYQYGIVHMYIPISGSSNTLKQRMTSLILVTTTQSEAVAQSTAYRTEVVASGSGYYSFTLWQHRGYAFNNDSALSEYAYAVAGSGTLRIDSAVINGSNLEIVIRNQSASFTGTYNFDVRWRVWTP